MDLYLKLIKTRMKKNNQEFLKLKPDSKLNKVQKKQLNMNMNKKQY